MTLNFEKIDNFLSKLNKNVVSPNPGWDTLLLQHALGSKFAKVELKLINSLCVLCVNQCKYLHWIIP